MERHGALLATQRATQPLFVCWAPHIVHAPLQVPDAIAAQFDDIARSAAGDNAKGACILCTITTFHSESVK